MQTFVKADEPKLIELGGGQSRKIRAYNQEMMLVEVIFESGAVGSDHSHEHTQISYVLSGEFTYHIEGETRRMLPGDSIVVDSGKVHGCACVKAGTLLDIFAPMREDFVR
ncbi:MAG: cupin domain-containing protein [Candidatus Ventricola sp.]|nr:cupin domain-containing protein [Candidatus Ventricola sp.]